MILSYRTVWCIYNIYIVTPSSNQVRDKIQFFFPGYKPPCSLRMFHCHLWSQGLISKKYIHIHYVGIHIRWSGRPSIPEICFAQSTHKYHLHEWEILICFYFTQDTALLIRISIWANISGPLRGMPEVYTDNIVSFNYSHPTWMNMDILKRLLYLQGQRAAFSGVWITSWHLYMIDWIEFVYHQTFLDSIQ